MSKDAVDQVKDTRMSFLILLEVMVVLENFGIASLNKN